MEIPWKTPTLNKGQDINRIEGDFYLSVGHLDRTVDPYLALVMEGWTTKHTGLYPTLAAARQACEQKYEELESAANQRWFEENKDGLGR